MAIHAPKASAAIKRATSRKGKSSKPRSGTVTTQSATTRVGGGDNFVAGTVVPRVWSILRRRTP